MGNTTSKTEPTSNNTQRRQPTVAMPRPGIKNRHPPSYNTLYPGKADPPPPNPVSDQGSECTEENLRRLRARNLTLALEPPTPKHTSRETAEAAAQTAMEGVGIGYRFCHKDPALLAAHIARTIAIAVSTSGSHAAFLAATHAAENGALILHETRNDKYEKGRIQQRAKNAVHSAVEFAMAAEADHATSGTWPSSTGDAITQ